MAASCSTSVAGLFWNLFSRCHIELARKTNEFDGPIRTPCDMRSFNRVCVCLCVLVLVPVLVRVLHIHAKIVPAPQGKDALHGGVWRLWD